MHGGKSIWTLFCPFAPACPPGDLPGWQPQCEEEPKCAKTLRSENQTCCIGILRCWRRQMLPISHQIMTSTFPTVSPSSVTCLFHHQPHPLDRGSVIIFAMLFIMRLLRPSRSNPVQWLSQEVEISKCQQRPCHQDWRTNSYQPISIFLQEEEEEEEEAARGIPLW